MSPLLSFALVFVVMFIFTWPLLGPFGIPVGLIFAFIVKTMSSKPKRTSVKTHRADNNVKEGISKETIKANEDNFAEEIQDKNQKSSLKLHLASEFNKSNLGNIDIAKIGIIICFVALIPWPTPFYMFTRMGIFICSVLLATQLYKSNPNEEQGWWILLCVTAIIFNPIFPIYLHSQPLWMIIDILTALLFHKAGKMISQFNDEKQKGKQSPWT
jgi:hypothetical protein